ncbi:MAG: exosortase/archaeosortase family protein [Bacteroidetes bacterium]|nr:exosortase/archaeosortase family protein [Bacteroidota bacterium]
MKLSLLKDNKIVRFIVLFIVLYLFWLMLYEWVIHPWGKLDTLVINDSSLWTAYVLEIMGYESFISDNATIRTVGIDGTHGLWIGDPCNGLTLFALFTIFIVAFPGPWKHKLWFIPVGITVIHFLNVVRITALCVIVLKRPEWLDFNHTYTFQLLMYGFIFGLWWIWIQKLSSR